MAEMSRSISVEVSRCRNVLKRNKKCQ